MNSSRSRTRSAPLDEPAASLAPLRNLGPASAAMLIEAGITSPEMLRELGAVEAFRRVVFARGGRASANLLWALEGALTDTRWDALDERTKARLRVALDASDGSAFRR